MFRRFFKSLMLEHPTADDVETIRDFDFPASDDRVDSWRYALLSHRGGHLFKTYVNIERNVVEIERGVIENHLLERRLDVDLHCDGIAR